MTNKKALGELVTFENSQGLRLDGILYNEDSNDTTIIHVHGSFGNFYHNHFLRVMAMMYSAAGFNFLSFNLSAHDGLAEAIRHTGKSREKWEYVGYSIVNFLTSIYDIEGAVNFAKQFSSRIILQGHSLGCDRILLYLTRMNTNYEFILLGPSDGYKSHANWIAPETVEQQIYRLKNQPSLNDEYDWLPISEYGIKQSGLSYNIPITRDALLSIIDGPAFQLINIKFSPQYWIDQRAIIYIGGKEDYQTWSVDIMFNYFEERIRDIKKIFIPTGDHNFRGFECEVIQKIINWIVD